MTVCEVPGATGLLDTNYEGKVAAALEFLRQGDFVFLHVEAPDECGHGGDVAGKVEAIRRFDARILAPLREALGDTAAFLVACDHPTPIELRTHSADPVPFLFWRPGLGASGVDAFTERTAATTGLTVAPGFELLSRTLDWARSEVA